MASEVVVSGRLSTRSTSNSSWISAKGVKVPHSDGAVGVNVIERRLQRARARIRTVSVLNPSVLKVRLQLGDVVVSLGGLRRGLLVGFTLVHRPVVEEHLVIWRNLSPLDGH